MAKKKNRQEPESEPRELAGARPDSDGTSGDGTRGTDSKGVRDQGDLPIDETIRIEGEDSTPDVSEHEPLVKELMETTIEGLASSAADEPSEELSTIVPDPDGTIIPEDETAGADEASDGDPDATLQNLESTVRIDPSEDDEATPVADSNERTLGSGDQTIAIQLPKASQGGPTIRSGKVSRGTSKATRQSGTTVNVEKDGSILASSNIDVTINPRELSEQDANLWNSAVGENSDDPSVLPPAIDRTFSDTQFSRLRKCNVAELKSDVAKASDYRLVRKLGQGGMGDVYTARQGSLDRLLALKLIKPLTGKKRAQLIKTGKLKTVEEERRQQFLSEAIVTGDLDHPNIVPIHDVALTSNNEIFYSMKRVIGTPWSDVIKENSRDENLEILMKVADAVGFAHERHVVHRDIKPENIMIGKFGVVMVMDWGLALPTSEYERLNSIFATSGLGGTPAFMAPEMAIGPLQKIGPASDLYLLGATLYMIITGRAPHQAKNVTECLQAVRTNAIRPVPQEQQGELLDIALKAMATKPEDRYENVEAFQQAIRDYRSHAESISLASRAAEDLENGKRNHEYEDLSRAAFRFKEAIDSWSENEKARQGLAETKLVHANVARENGDFDLGLSLLDEHDPEHQPLIRQLQKGKSRLTWLKRGAAAMLATIIIGGAGAGAWIYHEKNIAEENTIIALKQTRLATQAKAELEVKNDALIESVASETAAKERAESERVEAERARAEAERAQDAAEIARAEAETARDQEKVAKKKETDAKKKALAAKAEADNQRKEAVRQREEAVAAKKIAEYEVYASSIALAKARLSTNEADGARAILDQLEQDAPEATKNWEWRWLRQQAHQSESFEKTDDALIDMSLGSSGRRGVVAMSDGNFQLLQLNRDGRLPQERIAPLRLPNRSRATAVAMARDESSIAVGTREGQIFVFPLEGSELTQDRIETVTPLSGHEGRITDLQFSADGLLLSGSMDKTVRVWDVHSSTELTKLEACWHISAVRQLAVTGPASAMKLAVAISDDETGRVAIWELSRKGDEVAVKRQGTLTEHEQPVSSVAISEDGKRVASGDIEGNVLVWDRTSVPVLNYGNSIKNALAKINGDPVSESDSAVDPEVQAVRLVDSSLETEQRFISTTPSPRDTPRAHGDAVKAIRFSRDGDSLVTSSDDYTLKLWDVGASRIIKTLKGHGGWVVSADFLRGETDVIVSASNDTTVRTWSPSRYVGAFVRHQLGDEPLPTREALVHTKGIWSARFSRDGKKVVTASGDHTARVMEIDEQTKAFRHVATLDDRVGKVLDEGTSFVAMSVNVDRPHQRLYIGSADTTIRVWDLQRGTQIGEATGTGLNTSFAVSEDGRLMLTGSSSPDAKAILWKLDPEGTSPPDKFKRLQGHDQAVTAFAISSDSKRLFTGDRAGYGIVWDASTGERVGSPVEIVRGFRINAASFSADNRQLLIASDNRELTIVDLNNPRNSDELDHDGFVGFVTQLSVSSDGNHALAISELSTDAEFRSTATLWDLRSRTGRDLDTVTQKRGGDDGSSKNRRRITSARFDSTGRIAAIARSAVDGSPSSVKVWNLNLISADSTAAPSPQHSYQLPSVLGTAEAVLPIDAQSLLTLNKNAAFKWDLESDKLIKSYRAHAELPEACFSFDGKYVVTASRGVKIWDATTGKALANKALAKLESTRPIRSVQFAPVPLGPTQYLFATGGDEGIAKVWVWNPKTQETKLYKELMCSDDNESRTIRRLRFSPTSNQLFIVGDRQLARLWDFEQPAASVSMNPTEDVDLTCAAFSRDGNYVAAGGTDAVVRIWKLPLPGQELEPPVVLQGHADVVNDITFLGGSNSTMRVMTASSDDSAKVWDPRLDADDKKGREIISLRRHAGDVTSVDVTDNGHLLMTAGQDGVVILWPAEPPPPNLFDELIETPE